MRELMVAAFSSSLASAFLFAVPFAVLALVLAITLRQQQLRQGATTVVAAD